MQDVGEQFRADMVEDHDQDEATQPDMDILPDAHDRASLFLSVERLHEAGAVAERQVGLRSSMFVRLHNANCLRCYLFFALVLP